MRPAPGFQHGATGDTEQRLRRKFLRRWLALTFCLTVTGCESQAVRMAHEGVEQYYAGDYNAARAALTPLSDKTDQNFVLNNCRLGSAALAVFDVRQAQNAFQKSYEVMNSVGVNNGGRTLGATLVDEKIKVWQGEPFDRAMTNFYLGLTFYIQHDYNNARAAFENALFKLRDYGAEDNKGDQYSEVETNFALATLMLAKSWQRLGRNDLAHDAFQKVIRQRPDLASLADENYNATTNVLLVIDYGYGPQKVTDFNGSIVGFGPTPAQEGPVPEPSVMFNNRYIDLGGLPRPSIDLLRIAQDRRWQSIDTIRVVKSAIGTGLIGVGAVEGLRSNNRGNIEAGAAMVAAGLLLKATSQADTRRWEMLPRSVFILPLRVQPGSYDLTLTFPQMLGENQSWRHVPVPTEGEVTYYFRAQRFSLPPQDWPPVATTMPASAK